MVSFKIANSCCLSALAVLFFNYSYAMEEEKAGALHNPLSASQLKRIKDLEKKYQDTSSHILVQNAIDLDSKRVCASKVREMRKFAFEENVLLTLAADKGDVQAMWLKAKLYGNGVLKPNPMQLVYLENAAQGGLPEAQFSLAELLHRCGKPDKAYAWYRAFIDNAQVTGWRFSTGQGYIPVVAVPYRDMFSRVQHMCGAYLLGLNRRYEALAHLKLVTPDYASYADVKKMIVAYEPTHAEAMLAGAGADAVEYFYLGKDCYKREDVLEARKLFESAARLHFMPAQYWLAQLAYNEKRIAQWCNETDVAVLEYVVKKAYESKNVDLVRFVGSFLKKKNSAVGIYFLTRSLLDTKKETDADQITSCFKVFLNGMSKKQAPFLEWQSDMARLLENAFSPAGRQDVLLAWFDCQIAMGDVKQGGQKFLDWAERIDIDRLINDPCFDSLIHRPIFLELERLAQAGDARAANACGQYLIAFGSKAKINGTGPLDREKFYKGVDYILDAYRKGHIEAGIAVCGLRRLGVTLPGVDGTLTHIACDLIKRGGGQCLKLLPGLNIAARESDQGKAILVRVLLEFAVVLNDPSYAVKAVDLIAMFTEQLGASWHHWLVKEGVVAWVAEHEHTLPQLFLDKQDSLVHLYFILGCLSADEEASKTWRSRSDSLFDRVSDENEPLFADALKNHDFEKACRIITALSTPAAFMRRLPVFTKLAEKDSLCALRLGSMYLTSESFKMSFAVCDGEFWHQLNEAQQKKITEKCFAHGVGHLKDAIRLDPHNVAAYEGLVKYLYEVSGSLDDVNMAFSYAKKCVEDEKNDSAYCSFIMSRCLYLGQGVKQNQTKARKLILELAENGVVAARLLNACVLCREGGYEQAFKHLNALIDGNFVPAATPDPGPLDAKPVPNEIAEEARMRLGLMFLEDCVEADFAAAKAMGITLSQDAPDCLWAKRELGILMICSAMRRIACFKVGHKGALLSSSIINMFKAALNDLYRIEAGLRPKKNESKEAAADRQQKMTFLKTRMAEPLKHVGAELGFAGVDELP